MHQSTYTWYLIAMVVVTISILGLIVWAWGAFLDRYEHDPGKVRAVMFLILSAVMAFETGLCASGITHPSIATLSVLVNVWGGFDALLRFPASHSLESFFSAKQFVLIAVKTVGYAFGFVTMRHHSWIFILTLLLNIWGLPILYIMALPLDPMEQVVKHDEYDVDLLLRVWQLAVCSHERRRCIDTCRWWLNRRLVSASEHSYFARIAICAASPHCQKAFSKKRRVV